MKSYIAENKHTDDPAKRALRIDQPYEYTHSTSAASSGSGISSFLSSL